MNTRIDLLMSELQRHGIRTGRELCTAVGVSQPTLARLLGQLGDRRIVRIGRARATRYGLRRDIRGLGSDWPLYRILENGEAALVGRLYAITGGAWYLEGRLGIEGGHGFSFQDGIYPDLPWFLQDLRPRGFLGRAMAHRYADELGTPRDPRDWSGDDIVQSLIIHGGELPGSFALGRRALAAAQSSALNERDVIEALARGTIYPARAGAVMRGERPASSAAGEQPKFTARVRGGDGGMRCVIVKFSGAAGRPEDRRWADLLVAEHEANCVLIEAGVPCAATTVLESEGRCFLESTRFDRTVAGYKRRNWDTARGSLSYKKPFIESSEETQYFIADSPHPLRNLICSNSLITLLS